MTDNDTTSSNRETTWRLGPFGLHATLNVGTITIERVFDTFVVKAEWPAERLKVTHLQEQEALEKVRELHDQMVMGSSLSLKSVSGWYSHLNLVPKQSAGKQSFALKMLKGQESAHLGFWYRDDWLVRAGITPPFMVSVTHGQPHQANELHYASRFEDARKHWNRCLLALKGDGYTPIPPADFAGLDQPLPETDFCRERGREGEIIVGIEGATPGHRIDAFLQDSSIKLATVEHNREPVPNLFCVQLSTGLFKPFRPANTRELDVPLLDQSESFAALEAVARAMTPFTREQFMDRITKDNS